MNPSKIWRAIESLPLHSVADLGRMIATNTEVLQYLMHGLEAVSQRDYIAIGNELGSQGGALADIHRKRRRPKKGNEVKYNLIDSMKVNDRVQWGKVFRRFGIGLKATKKQNNLKRRYRHWKTSNRSGCRSG